MKLIKVGAAALNQTPLDWSNNLNNINEAIEQARKEAVSVLCLPELCITGYGCEDAFHAPHVLYTALEIMQEIAPLTRGMVVSAGLPLSHAGGLFNAACVLVDGKIAGFVCKQHLAGDGIHYEPRWFKPWPNNTNTEVEIGEQEYPIGDLLFDCEGVKIGFEVCEDAWVGIRPGADLAAQGADIILNPSASHFAFDKHEVRRRFVLEGSRAFFVTYVYANLLGNEAGRAIYDGGTMIASGGRLIIEGPRFSYKNVQLATAIVDVDATRMMRSRTGSFEPAIEKKVTEIIDVDFNFPPVKLSGEESSSAAWERNPELKCEEFSRAVALGLFDYIRKSRSSGVVISLSGGADSTAVAVLSFLMIKFALAELDATEIADLLQARIDHSSSDSVVDQLSKQLITTVYQATRHSSQTTRNAAKTIADAVGANHLEFDIDDIVNSYRNMVESSLGRKLTWEEDDIALQNIQSRVRSPGVWMLANISNSLLLSTSNRSEAAVGYATMDGDTSGGLAPIAGIDKAFLRKWLRWMENTGPENVGSMPALNCVNILAPTAELRPAEEKQTDEDDLMPYEVLDQVERLAIRDKLSPSECLEHLEIKFHTYSREQLIIWIERFFRLWCRNQWKRERYAPSFHLDDANLDPKTWCRFPILSGGYTREIKHLRELNE